MERAYYCEIENDYCSYRVASIITDCFDIDSLRFSFTWSLFPSFRDLKRIERPVDRSLLFFLFFFLSLPLLYSFPPSPPDSTFPICIEMKTYLFGGLRPKSPFVFGRMDVPCTREFVYTSLCICREHARFHRAPLLFIRFLLLFSVSRTESTMKEEEEKEEEDSPCAIVPTFECVR